jgi:hypothetical protein
VSLRGLRLAVVAINAPKFHCRQSFREVGADRTRVDAVHNDAPAELEYLQIAVRVQRSFHVAITSGGSAQRIRQPRRDRR